MVTGVGGDDVVAGLGAAVEADDGGGLAAAGEEVDEGAFTAIAEGEVDDEDGAAVHAKWRCDVPKTEHVGDGTHISKSVQVCSGVFSLDRPVFGVNGCI